MQRIAAETLTEIVSFLRARDICNCLETNKTLFSNVIIARAIEKLLIHQYQYIPSSIEECRPALLFHCEINMILGAINSPLNSKESMTGFWISSTWLTNAKLYFEAIPLPDLPKPSSSSSSGHNSVKKVTPLKKLKIRARRGSDALPPWPLINNDILCCHQLLAPNKGLKAKRRVIEKKNWNILRKFFAEGPEFRSNMNECSECSQSLSSLKEIKPLEAKRARFIDPNSPLAAVFARKSGVPSHCLTIRDEIEASMAALRPLLPGLYFIIPRDWLRLWRLYMKDSSIAMPPLFDCSTLLCEEHNLLLVPPHAEEYLVGIVDLFFFLFFV